jgi:hypothetical protein
MKHKLTSEQYAKGINHIEDLGTHFSLKNHLINCLWVIKNIIYDISMYNMMILLCTLQKIFKNIFPSFGLIHQHSCQ